jgi:hypothetical protein
MNEIRSKKFQNRAEEINYIDSLNITKEVRFMKRVLTISAMAILFLSIICLTQTSSIRMAGAQTLPPDLILQL